MYIEILNDMKEILKEEDFSKRKGALINQKNILVDKIKDKKENVKYVLLLLVLDLELRLENEEIKDAQDKLFDQCSVYWNESDVALWKINYAGFLFEEEKEYEQALRILEKMDIYSSEYAEKYSIMGQIYYINEEFQKAEECFKTAVDLCKENRLPYRYREYILAYVKCQYMNEKYEEVASGIETNIKEFKWNDIIDVEMISVLVLTYIKLKYEVQVQILLSEIELHKAEIVNLRYGGYFDDIIDDMEPEGLSICPYIYCPRHYIEQQGASI